MKKYENKIYNFLLKSFFSMLAIVINNTHSIRKNIEIIIVDHLEAISAFHTYSNDWPNQYFQIK